MFTSLRQRIDRATPLVFDSVLAAVLALLAMAQVWMVDAYFARMGPLPPGAPHLRIPLEPPGSHAITYLLVAGCFVPLALRRTRPYAALALTGVFALVYGVRPGPPAFTLLGPMIALYSAAALTPRRRVGWLAPVVIAAALAIPLIAASENTRWLRESVSAVVLMSAAAFLGDSARSRREYVEAVEQRAVEAERTREEEARRRVDEERIRIAREVHDVLAHSLSIVTVQAAAAETLIERDPARARESIGHIRATGKQALAELRSMLDVMRTGEGDARLDPAASIADVENLVAPVREAGFDVRLLVDGDLEGVPAFASVSGYRIVQEALTNAVRHASPTRIDVRVEAAPDWLAIEVDDDGIGASGSAGANGAYGHGIRGMRERVEALGGTFAAGPREVGGFSVTARIPLRRKP